MRASQPLVHVLLLLILIPFGCASDNDSAAQANTGKVKTSKGFDAYWNQGKAEISSYNLSQSRYGQLHEGKAVFVYVTENFSDKDHHKINNPVAKAAELVPILKLNMTKKFNTGIYPYSLMKSIFSPVDAQSNPHALRVTGSMQEWCGHAFTQLDRYDQGWVGNLYSYFESEGDHKIELADAWSEDEIWTLLRLDPSQLPQGKFKMIPSVYYNRLSHRPLAVETATATMSKDGSLSVYTINYPEFNRTVAITFEDSFPFQIQQWTDTYRGLGGKVLTTTGTLDKTMMLDYWNKNDVADTKLRKQLNLD